MSSPRAPRRPSFAGSPAIRLAILTLAALIGSASPVAGASGTPGASPSPSAAPPVSVPVPINTGAIVGLTGAGTQNGHAVTTEGWGVVIDPSGLILANASVVQPDAPGVAAGYGDPSLTENITDVQIWTAAAGQPLAATWTAKVLAVDGFLDLAIIAPDATVGDNPTPVAAGSLNVPSLAVAAAMPAVGTSIVGVAIAGGPSTAPLSVAAYAAKVTALNRPTAGSCCPVIVSDLAMPDAWPGGVLLTDSTGALLDFPAYILGFVPSVAYGTTADVIGPLLAAAKAGTPYTTTFGTPGTGDETLTFRTWSTAQNPCASSTTGRVSNYPPNTSRITAAFDATKFTQHEDVLEVWVRPDTQQLLGSFSDPWTQASGSGCASYGINSNSGPLPNGSYELDVYAGGTLRQVSSTTVKVGVAPGSIVLTGRVLDADTGQPIVDALVAILKPGTDIQSWFTSPTEDAVATLAFSGDDGTFTTDPPIPQGSYPFLIEADGYQPTGGTLKTGTTGVLGDVGLAPLP